LEKIVERINTVKLNKIGRSSGELAIVSFLVNSIFEPHKTDKSIEPKINKAILLNSKKSVVMGRKNIGTKNDKEIITTSISLFIIFKFFVFIH